MIESCNGKSNLTIPILKRASSVIESPQPNSKGDFITFIRKENTKKSEISFLQSPEIIDHLKIDEKKDSSRGKTDGAKSDSNEKNIIDDNKNKNNPQKKKTEEEPILIKEDDIFFEEILRTKLLKKEQRDNPKLIITHMDALKIPFSEDPEYFDEELIEKVVINLEGNFELRDLFIESKSSEEIISLVNKKEDEVYYRIFNKLKFKISTKEEKRFVGINIKKINETYYISYVYAKEI